MEITRAELLDQLSKQIVQLFKQEPTLVAIDGRSAAGKTTLADELAAHMQQRGHHVLRSSIDDFHPPKHKYRSGERRYTPSTYYAEGYDYAAFRNHVLEPLRQEGSRRCRLALWNSFHDIALPEQWTEASNDTILVVDGIFLLRPDLQHFWNYVVWLDIDWGIMLERAVKRDTAWVGDAALVLERYRTFWIPTHQLYEAEANPLRFAHLIVNNRNPLKPDVVKQCFIEPRQ